MRRTSKVNPKQDNCVDLSTGTLNWFDLEVRCKTLCHSLIMPLMDEQDTYK